MRAALWVLVLVVAPGGLFVAQCEGIRWLSEGEAPRPLRPVVTRSAAVLRALRPVRRREPLPQVLLALELRRLAAEVRRIDEGRQPHRAARLAAALAAYDHVLLQLCEAAQLEHPRGLPPLSSRVRLDLEAELVASGVDW